MSQGFETAELVKQKLTFLCRAAEVPEQGVKQVAPAGMDAEFAVYRLDGEFYASDDLCTHAMVSLSYGDVEDGQIHCPMHGGAFDIRTGAPTALPCRIKLKTYKVVAVGDDLYAELS